MPCPELFSEMDDHHRMARIHAFIPLCMYKHACTQSDIREEKRREEKRREEKRREEKRREEKRREEKRREEKRREEKRREEKRREEKRRHSGSCVAALGLVPVGIGWHLPPLQLVAILTRLLADGSWGHAGDN
ncbi:hypothetical protein GBF38_011335 [Nibea albiflora]|uniref:Uncharacterized protein n=1 Tax=Nibea albiflora TaxID=240163 RepID=A0ACB7ESY3_NIBAL|nr:hypothetical protein GBF38_011335 [Nibea albiflora]